VHYFTANPNGEAEIIRVVLRPNPKLKITSFEYDFSTLAIKGRGSMGNIITKKPVKSITKKEEGISTLGAREIWFDDSVKRLNVAERGKYLGAFMGEDRILTIMDSGYYRHYKFDLSTHFDEDMILIEKSDPRKIMTVVFWDAAQKYVYLKRFKLDTSHRKIRFIGDHADSKMLAFSLDYLPVLQVKFDEKANGKTIDDLILETEGFIGIKSYKAKGKRLSTNVIKSVKFLKPLPYEIPEEEEGAQPEIDKDEKNNGKEAKPKKQKPGKEKEPPEKSDDDGQIKLIL
jgi:topoisomerase-4 subunit A